MIVEFSLDDYCLRIFMCNISKYKEWFLSRAREYVKKEKGLAILFDKRRSHLAISTLDGYLNFLERKKELLFEFQVSNNVSLTLEEGNKFPTVLNWLLNIVSASEEVKNILINRCKCRSFRLGMARNSLSSSKVVQQMKRRANEVVELKDHMEVLIRIVKQIRLGHKYLLRYFIIFSILWATGRRACDLYVLKCENVIIQDAKLILIGQSIKYPKGILIPIPSGVPPYKYVINRINSHKTYLFHDCDTLSDSGRRVFWNMLTSVYKLYYPGRLFGGIHNLRRGAASALDWRLKPLFQSIAAMSDQTFISNYTRPTTERVRGLYESQFVNRKN